MDILEFLAVMIPILMCGFLVFRWISLADARARIELQKRLAKSKQMTSANQRRQIEEEEEADLGAWVGPLLEEFGVDPDVLFSDEMPRELKMLVPLAKGFVKGGGLQKLLAGAQAPQEQAAPDRQSI